MPRATRAATEDCGAHYAALRADLVELVRPLDAAARTTRVPASPEWCVTDVVSHVAGICRDLNHQRFPTGSADDWTAAQVAWGRTLGFDEVVADWTAESPTFEQGLRDFGYSMGCHFVGDLFVHATDVSAALGAPIDRTSVRMWITFDWYLESLGEDLTAGSGALRVRAGGEDVTIGSGPVRATLSAPPFEILRACAGRRTRDEIARFAWEGEAGSFVERLSRYAIPAAPVGP